MAGRQRGSTDWVENGQASSWCGHSSQLEQSGRSVGTVGKKAGREDHVDHASWQRKSPGVGSNQHRHTVPSRSLGFRQHGAGDVDADYQPRATDGLSQDGKGPAGTAADVERHAALGWIQFSDRSPVGGTVVGKTLLPFRGPRPEELLGRGQVARLIGTGCRGGRPYRDRMAVTIYGVIALTFMMVMYALERRRHVYLLGFALGCVLSSVYGFLSGAWPFGVVELIWAGIALRRYDITRLSSQ